MLKPTLREIFADLSHRVWSQWMGYLFNNSATNPDGSVTISKELAELWRSEMKTPYALLPKKKQISDRFVADLYLAEVKRADKTVKKPSDPRVKEVKEAFIKYCENIRGFTPEINHALEGAMIKKRLETYSVEDIKDCFDWFMNNEDYRNFSCSIKTILSNSIFNKWLEERE